MNIEFRRDLNSNYLILECNIEEYNNNYQYEMIANNQLKGFLKCDIRHINSDIRLYYDITSKQAFTRVIGRKPLEYEDICNIVLQLTSAVKVLCDYLLPEKNIILDRDYIYIDVEKYQLYFCYFPEWNKDPFVGIREFIEYLMQNTNHNDKKATELIYELYKRTLEEAFEIGELEEVIENRKIEESNEENFAGIEETFDSKPKEKENKTGYSKVKLNDTRMNIIALLILVFILCFYLYKKIVNKYIFFIGILIVAFIGFVMLILRKIKSNSKNNDILSNIEFDNEESPIKEEFIGDTCLLSEDNEKMHYLVDEKTGKKIILSKYPFVLGKHGDYVDGIIEDGYVSRLHFQINYEYGLYFIKDLSSMNGTFVNGIELNPGIDAELKEGDVIKVGNTTFSFV